MPAFHLGISMKYDKGSSRGIYFPKKVNEKDLVPEKANSKLII